MMFWEDDTTADDIPLANVVDLAFSIQCRQLPVDHLHALSSALQQALPNLQRDGLGIHEIHIAGSQNGWERPDPELGQYLTPSRRTRFSIRAPKNLAAEVIEKLQGLSLDLDGCELTLGKVKERPISHHDTLYARHVAILDKNEEDDENLFLKRIARELKDKDIKVRKALCGKTSQIHTPEGPLSTRSLMIADLKPADAIKLQEEGLGRLQHLGCGLFLPMKGIQQLSSDTGD